MLEIAGADTACTSSEIKNNCTNKVSPRTFHSITTFAIVTFQYTTESVEVPIWKGCVYRACKIQCSSF